MNFSESLNFFVAIVVVFWLTGLTLMIYQIKRQTRNQADLGSDKIKDELAKVKKLDQDLQKISLEIGYHIQKIGLMRYNPFAQTGGDQSFSLAIMDSHNNGLILTSLHNREATRLYAKAIAGGKAQGYDLSNEEVLAIKNAKKIK
jgi:hypothetical protein